MKIIILMLALCFGGVAMAQYAPDHQPGTDTSTGQAIGAAPRCTGMFC